MIKIVIMAVYLCKHYTPTVDITQAQCQKAYITCVDRTLWDMEDHSVSNMSQDDKEREAVLHCHTKLFTEEHNNKPFMEYLR